MRLKIFLSKEVDSIEQAEQLFAVVKEKMEPFPDVTVQSNLTIVIPTPEPE